VRSTFTRASLYFPEISGVKMDRAGGSSRSFTCRPSDREAVQFGHPETALDFEGGRSGDGSNFLQNTHFCKSQRSGFRKCMPPPMALGQGQPAKCEEWLPFSPESGTGQPAKMRERGISAPWPKRTASRSLGHFRQSSAMAPKRGLCRIEFSGIIGPAKTSIFPGLAGTPARLHWRVSCFRGFPPQLEAR